MEKYIVFGGCSYSHKNPQTVQEIVFNKKVEDFDGSESINQIFVGNSAYSNKLISESIILSVETLLKNKVNPKNILVINNFTQVGRENVLVPKELSEIIKKNIIPDITPNDYNITSKTYEGFVENQNSMYSLLTSDYNNPSIRDWSKTQEKYFFSNKTEILYFEEYLKDIIILQTYLSSVNVESISYMMSNVFEGWSDGISHIYTSNTEWSLPSLKDTKHIKEMSNICNVMWEMIDLSKFAFYTQEENKYGGVDEFFINEIIDETKLEDYSKELGHFYGRHPNHEVYSKFTKKVLSKKIIEWKLKSNNL